MTQIDSVPNFAKYHQDTPSRRAAIGLDHEFGQIAQDSRQVTQLP